MILPGDGQSLEKAILTVARQAILKQLPWGEEDITFRVAQPIGRDLKFVSKGMSTLDAQVRTAGPPIGRVVVDVTVSSGENAPISISVTYDVRHYEQVVTTLRPIPRGRTITSEDLCLNRWDVTGAAGYSTQLDQVVGRVAGRPLPELQIVKDQDFDGTGPASPLGKDRPIVIKRQDRVKLTASVGNFDFGLTVEAMQNGHVGEIIQLQNIESKQLVKGRVVNANEVEIVY